MTTRQHLRHLVHEQLRKWLGFCWFLFWFLLATDPWTVPKPYVDEALLIHAVAIAILWRVRRAVEAGALPLERAEQAAVLFGISIQCTSTLFFILAEDPYYDVYVQLLLIVMGSLILSIRSAVFLSTVLVSTWLAAHLWVYSPVSTESFLLTGSAVLLGLYAVTSRRVVAVEQWERQAAEKRSSTELAAALKAAEEAGALLNAEVSQASKEVGHALDQLNLNREERIAVHRHLLHSNRLNSLGRLAGGIAHRLNNRLLVLMGTVDNLEMEPYGPEGMAAIREVRTAVERGAKLTEQLLPLTGDHLLTPKVCSVDSLIQDFESMLCCTRTHLQIENHTREASILVDPQAWFRIISNLVRNADEASDPGKTVRLLVEQRESSILFSVEDQGPGVPAEYREKIFEPFFTTKSRSGGSGLGLAMVLGLAEQMGATVTVSSNRDGGATFSVGFESSRKPQVIEPQQRPVSSAELRGQKVLVVEDDPKVLHALENHLLRLGLSVSTASNGEEGLARFEEEPVRLIITDVVMPSMDGPTMVKELWRRDPCLKVLFTSGYSDDRLRQAGIESGFEFLPKPYSRENLTHSLQKIFP